MKLIKFITVLVSFGLSFSSVANEHLTHKGWNTLLNKHVDEAGNVDYKGFKSEEKALNEYLTVLSKNHPDNSWKRNDRLAFWINAYNASTVKLIVKNYPVKSIKDLGGSIYKVNTPWDIKFIKIGEEVYDLNNIEHGMIRKEFSDPRIHFAVNCASVSCPKLRNEAYVGTTIEQQLEDQAKYFINNKVKNQIKSTKKANLSKIFRWYKGDFTSSGMSIVEYINQYADVKLEADAKIEFLDYDWDLNGK
jgi:hypothetical protein